MEKNDLILTWIACRRLAAILLAVFGLAACSNESLYKAIQQNRLQACEEIPIVQQAACKSQYDTDYDSYRRERSDRPFFDTK